MADNIPLSSKTDMSLYYETSNTLLSALKVSKSARKLLINDMLRTWQDVSRLNYLNHLENPTFKSLQNVSKLRSFAFTKRSPSLETIPTEVPKEDAIDKTRPRVVLSLMDENQLWGCFYPFPHFYADAYSPTVRILELQEQSESDDGVLTREMVACCLSYLRRIPILGDFVYIKLDLSRKHLSDIEVLQHYKYLVYLDLTRNQLYEISVLSHLLYLQYLSVDDNRLSSVLEYSTPQWFLTEVHFKENRVRDIRDLEMFWSITILDLSHNNIKCISGLESLRYLRHLDLSFNHIECLENLNHLRILWLDLSYNDISTFELGHDTGLWTLLHLEYLNINENKLSSLKMFSKCTRLRELHARNNEFHSLLELILYMRKLRRLAVFDVRSNPIRSAAGFTSVVFMIFPLLINLNDVEVDPVYQRSLKMDSLPEVSTMANRRLMRMLYVEQLTRSRVPVTPPADTQEVALVVLVGLEAVGKGTLARKLASECSSKIRLARLHTTAVFHMPEHYIRVSREKFDNMLLAGEFLTYSELNGESYGLSREEAFISDGKVCICSMDLIGALTLKLRGRRPYLILTACQNVDELAERQQERKMARIKRHERLSSLMSGPSTLQVMVSGSIFIHGIINELLMNIPSEGKSVCDLESSCSLILNNDLRKAMKNHTKDADVLSMLTVSSSERISKGSQSDLGLYALYKHLNENVDEDRKSDSMYNDEERPANIDYTPDKDIYSLAQSKVKFSGTSYYQQDGNKSSLWKGEEASKSSKSVTFNANDLAGLDIDPFTEKQKRDFEVTPPSVSANISNYKHSITSDDADLWLAFLAQIGLLSLSDMDQEGEENVGQSQSKRNARNAESMIGQINFFTKPLPTAISANLRDDYEHIHRHQPGLFHDTIAMDDPQKAFNKAKRIIRDIVHSQSKLSPMFDIAFAKNLDNYPTVGQKLEDIRREIAPRQIFY